MKEKASDIKQHCKDKQPPVPLKDKLKALTIENKQLNDQISVLESKRMIYTTSARLFHWVNSYGRYYYRP
jgi:hypothetical protein